MTKTSRVIIVLSILITFSHSIIYAEADRLTEKSSFKNISSPDLKKMLSGKEDFVLIDVHIPEQKHLQGTDGFIPFNAIKKNEEKLPQKDTKIVLYCRSGSMSEQAAQKLIEMEYADVYNLEGGIIGWKKAGFKVEGPDRIIYLEAKRFSFVPSTIGVKKGNKVKIIAKSTDVAHGIGIKAFNINQSLPPGEEKIIEFTADKAGEFHFHCSVYCGVGHGRMHGTLIVKE